MPFTVSPFYNTSAFHHAEKIDSAPEQTSQTSLTSPDQTCQWFWVVTFSLQTSQTSLANDAGRMQLEPSLKSWSRQGGERDGVAQVMGVCVEYAEQKILEGLTGHQAE